MQKSAQNLAMGEVMAQLSACGQGEGSKPPFGAVLCQALTTDFLIKERKSVEPCHAITGLRANSRCALTEGLRGQAQSGWFLKCDQDRFMTQVIDETTGGDAGFAVHKIGRIGSGYDGQG